MRKTGYIYALVNPLDSAIFYVGSTQETLHRRLQNHINDAKVKSRPVSEKIRNIIESGAKPMIVLLETYKGKSVGFQNLNDREVFWIGLVGKSHSLTNKNSVSASHLIDETLANIAATRKIGIAFRFSALKKELRALGVTQNDIANATGLSKPTIANILRGKSYKQEAIEVMIGLRDKALSKIRQLEQSI